MKELFRTTLQLEGRTTEYAVHFEDDVYLFEPEGGSGATLRLFREHDEWKSDAPLAPNAFRAATDALDDYLLSQH